MPPYAYISPYAYAYVFAYDAAGRVVAGQTGLCEMCVLRQ